MKKTTYETPQAEQIEVRFEGNLCTSPGNYSTPGRVSNPEFYDGSVDDDMD